MTVTDLHTMQPCSLPDAPMAVAAGNFDGLHIGHRALLAACRAVRERDADCVCAVWTFHTHTRSADTPLLTMPADRLALFAQCGMDYAISVDFAEVRDLSPEQFVLQILRDALHCRTVLCGFNFRFGAGGRGTADDLHRIASLCGMECLITEDVTYGGETVSSTRIRNLIRSGDVETASRLMSRPFSFTAPVVPGQQLGRTMDFPTVNQELPCGLVAPAHGVYLTECAWEDTRCYGVTDFGVRPTVSGEAERCETHLLCPCGELYGTELCISFLQYIRPERKFGSVEELRRNVAGDVEECRRRIETLTHQS